VFSQPKFKELLQRYKLVQLYTDHIPLNYYAPALRSKLEDSDRVFDDAAVNSKFQYDAVKPATLPLYVILEPLEDGAIKVVSKNEKGKINDEAEFAKFLSDPLGPAVK
jgi:hypothetical protein